MKRKILSVLFALVMCVGIFFVSPASVSGAEVYTSENPLVVVLDPGHGGNDAGTTREYKGVTYQEAVYNLKISNYAREALSEYDNVLVYQTRVEHNHISLAARPEFANQVGADVFISLHINYSTATSAEGCMFYAPSGNYIPSLRQEAIKLGSKICSNFADLTLRDRGYEFKTLPDNKSNLAGKYPDGSAGDYYAVIRGCTLYGIPSIIFENAFISNDTDFGYLNDENMLKKFGEAIAKAVAKQYGLTKTGESVLEQPTLTCMSSGVLLTQIPKTYYTVGDVIDFSATGGSGTGDYWYYVSNQYCIRVDGNKGYIIGQSNFVGETDENFVKISATKTYDGTYTPRTSAEQKICITAMETIIQAEVVDNYTDALGKQVAVIKISPKSPIEGIDGIYPKGKAVIMDGPVKLAEASFDENSNETTITLGGMENGEHNYIVKYVQEEFDSYAMNNQFALTIEPAAKEGADATPIPSSKPTDSNETPNPDATSEVINTPSATFERKAATNNTTRIFMFVALGVCIVGLVVILIIIFSKKKTDNDE